VNVYNAIMRAADHIENHPNEFNFSSVWIPGTDDERSCGTPGCALGWIGHFAGVKGLSEIEMPWRLGFDGLWLDAVRNFYARMDALNRRWRRDSIACSGALRLYAEKYHSNEKPCRSDSELVADLMRRVNSAKIPDEAPSNAVRMA